LVPPYASTPLPYPPLFRSTAQADAARACFNEQIAAQGLTLVGWREVPVDTSVLGRLALERLPRIEQVFVSAEGLSEREFGIKLLDRKSTRLNSSHVKISYA